MTDATASSPAKPAIALGLTFLFVGLTFALPYQLIPDSVIAGTTSSNMAPEVANVYAIVAWAGWAHFIFAFRGQGRALISKRANPLPKWMLAFAACVAVSIAALTAIRWAVGPILFSAVVWVYFIDHFIKAERSFGGQGYTRSFVLRWLSSYQPLLTFSWLSAVLLGFRNVQSSNWALWSGSLLLAAFVLTFGGWRRLAEGNARSTLISLFFIAEALVWGTYSERKIGFSHPLPSLASTHRSSPLEC